MVRRCCAIYLLLLLSLVAYRNIFHPFTLPLYDEGLQFFDRHWSRYLLLLVTGFAAISILARPRYLLLKPNRGLLIYSLPIIGHRSYYFVEVCGIRVEVDMSEVLLKLDSIKLYRLYIKLHSGKLLLIREDTNEERNTQLCEQLQQIFSITTIEHLQRIGRKKGKEIHLGDYLIEKDLSHGGMGKVFLARGKDNAQVAIKILPACFALDEKYVTSFAREIQILQKLAHPSVVKIFDVGRDCGSRGDVYFYVMEFIEGKPLASFIETKELNYRESAQFALQIALALDYLHKHRVIHRDIKPSNIMIRNNGSIVLIDFGIARDEVRKMSRYRNTIQSVQEEISHYVGTPPYMSPEQLSSRETIDERTDIYSLGVTFYEMLTGTRPFKGGNITIYRSILNWYPPEPSHLVPGLPRELDIIVMKAIEKSKYKRYQSSAEMAEDLHRFLQGEAILSVRANWLIRAWRKLRGCFRWI
jgi:predicted Ser/Thr protein kinase